jgi:NAD+ kinase
MDIVLIPNRDKIDAVEAAGRLLTLLQQRLRQGGGPQAAQPESRVVVMDTPTRDDLHAFAPQLVVVLGGDGSILSTAQVLGQMRVAVAGINFGKLGYLAAFSLEQFIEHLDLILSGNAPSTERLMLQAAIYPLPTSGLAGGALRAGGGGPAGGVGGGRRIESLASLANTAPRASGIALNDVVINAGDPFRMIELEVQVDEECTTTFRSDGVVVSTASGSTGYNLSAGGPLISPEVEAMVLTPICPHSLSFRPVVLPATSSIVVLPHRLNAGSKVNFDGQVTLPIAEDECLLIRRAPTTFRLIENPGISHWQMLGHKLHWAQSPQS